MCVRRAVDVFMFFILHTLFFVFSVIPFIGLNHWLLNEEVTRNVAIFSILNFIYFCIYDNGYPDTTNEPHTQVITIYNGVVTPRTIPLSQYTAGLSRHKEPVPPPYEDPPEYTPR